MKTKIVELRPHMLGESVEIYTMFQELPEKEEYNQTNEFYGLSPNETREKICEMLKKEYCIDSKSSDSPSIIYVFYVDNKPVGFAGMKLKINRYWVVHSATIWYKIRPSERRKGYGTKLVKKLIQRCIDLGITYVNASTSVDNIASRTILAKNGFTFTNEQSNTVFYKLQLKDEPIVTSKAKGKFY
ncbi:MAG: GNAT family N-acetyltransferase [Clostridia bacterium]|nr:GNAT family N-acetyltransferase [Clostridia bacterium]